MGESHWTWCSRVNELWSNHDELVCGAIFIYIFYIKKVFYLIYFRFTRTFCHLCGLSQQAPGRGQFLVSHRRRTSKKAPAERPEADHNLSTTSTDCFKDDQPLWVLRTESWAASGRNVSSVDQNGASNSRNIRGWDSSLFWTLLLQTSNLQIYELCQV